MPTDLTGTPTSLGIGTYNVDADAPSGLGFNEAMAQIDALIAARAPKPTPTGAVLWNGTAWVSPTGTPDGTKFLRDDGSWAAPASVTKVSKLTTKTVSGTTSVTDLLNGEITIPANAFVGGKRLRLYAWGDFLNNTGAAANMPLLGLQVGGTVTIGFPAEGQTGNSTSRGAWSVCLEAIGLGSASQIWSWLSEITSPNGNGTGGVALFTTGTGHVFTYDQVGGGSTQGQRAQGVSSTAFDMTVARALALTVSNGSSSASYETKLYGALLEIV